MKLVALASMPISATFPQCGIRVTWGHATGGVATAGFVLDRKIFFRRSMPHLAALLDSFIHCLPMVKPPRESRKARGTLHEESPSCFDLAACLFCAANPYL